VRPIPVDRYLVPAQPAQPPGDAQVVDVLLLTGLPFGIPLGSDFALLLTFATGLATEWRGLDPHAVVSESSAEWTSRAADSEPVGDVKTGRLSLALQRGGRTVTVLPMVSGRHTLVEPGDPGARRFDIWLVGWDLRAGTVRGPGDFGSRVRLAWRIADKSVASFAPVPVNPMIVARVPMLVVPLHLTPEIRQLKIEDRALLKKGRLVQWRF
jgi:hypothetical protein